jgi:transcriptional regulator with XRE-family HTH domain
MKTTTFFIKARKALGIRQNKLAEQLKIRQVNLCKYERGFVEPPAQIAIKLFEILKDKNISI